MNSRIQLALSERRRYCGDPVYENERLAELTHWGAPWANLRVVVVGMGTSGDAVTDVLAQLGAHIGCHRWGRYPGEA